MAAACSWSFQLLSDAVHTGRDSSDNPTPPHHTLCFIRTFDQFMLVHLHILLQRTHSPAAERRQVCPMCTGVPCTGRDERQIACHHGNRTPTYTTRQFTFTRFLLRENEELTKMKLNYNQWCTNLSFCEPLSIVARILSPSRVKSGGGAVPAISSTVAYMSIRFPTCPDTYMYISVSNKITQLNTTVVYTANERFTIDKVLNLWY